LGGGFEFFKLFGDLARLAEPHAQPQDATCGADASVGGYLRVEGDFEQPVGGDRRPVSEAADAATDQGVTLDADASSEVGIFEPSADGAVMGGTGLEPVTPSL
jgi:hypothetical protein